MNAKTTNKELTPEEKVEAFSRKSDAVRQKLAEAVLAFREGKITQKELTAANREADKVQKELQQQIRDERRRK